MQVISGPRQNFSSGYHFSVAWTTAEIKKVIFIDFDKKLSIILNNILKVEIMSNGNYNEITPREGVYALLSKRVKKKSLSSPTR